MARDLAENIKVDYKPIVYYTFIILMNSFTTKLQERYFDLLQFSIFSLFNNYCT
jgi:hypothetical protein